MIKLQNDTQPTPTNAIEVDAAILDIQARLNLSLAWLTHGYGKTYRNVDTSRGVTVYFPEIFLGAKNYMRITPDNDKTGQSFMLVSDEQINDYEEGYTSFLSYDLGIVFTANLELINKTLLDTDYFQQNLIQEVRRVLGTQLVGGNYKLEINEVVREFSDVYSEFNIEEKRGVSHSPLTHFRFNCSLTLREYCSDVPFDRCATILSLINDSERDCLAAALGGGAPCDYNDCTTLLANLTETTKNTCILPTYVFTAGNDAAFSNLTATQINDLTARLCVASCVADFSVSTLAQAQQITYNVNDTICILDTKYKAVDVGGVTGFSSSAPSFSGVDFFYNHTAPDTAIYKVTPSGALPFYNLTQANNLGYNAFGQILIDAGFMYVETSAGAANNLGSVLKINLTTGTATKLLDFTSTTGFTSYILNPTGNKDKVVINGKLYINTAQGGANGLGTVLEIDINTGAHTVIYDLLNTPSSSSATSFSKGLAIEYGNDYVLIAHNVLFVYNTTAQTFTTQTLFVGVAAVNDFHLLGTDLYIVYNSVARFLKIDLTNYSLTVNQRLDTLAGSFFGANTYFSTTCFYDSALNRIVTKNYIDLKMISYDIATNTFVQETNHSTLSLPASITSAKTQVGDFVYFTNGATSNDQNFIVKYDIVNKTSTQLTNTQGSSFSPDGVNFLEVNQAPIYLELC